MTRLDLLRAYGQYESEREAVKQARLRKRQSAADKAKALRDSLGIALEDDGPIVFWPASDARFFLRLKRIAVDKMVECWDGPFGLQKRIGVRIPLPCLIAVLSEQIQQQAEMLDVVRALLRQTFYLNQWCRKGYRRGRASDASRYMRKDACLSQVIALATQCKDLKWGWQSGPDESG